MSMAKVDVNVKWKATARPASLIVPLHDRGVAWRCGESGRSRTCPSPRTQKLMRTSTLEGRKKGMKSYEIRNRAFNLKKSKIRI